MTLRHSHIEHLLVSQNVLDMHKIHMEQSKRTQIYDNNTKNTHTCMHKTLVEHT